MLRPFLPAEIEEQWQAMVTADPMTVAGLAEEAGFKARLLRSGRLVDGWLDLAIDLDGVPIGRIQTFVPLDRVTPSGTYDIGIGLRPDVHGRGYGREALMLLTGWLFEHAAAEVLEAPTASANTAMRTVLDRCGWALAGSVSDHGRQWLLYQITRQQWQARR